jgi:hypothetical protein
VACVWPVSAGDKRLRLRIEPAPLDADRMRKLASVKGYATILDPTGTGDARLFWASAGRSTGWADAAELRREMAKLDCETGVGLDGQQSETGLLLAENGDFLITEDGDQIALEFNVVQGSDPQVMLRWSDDAGHTWSNEHWKSMGKIGRYGFRTIWRRLGATMKIRDRVYEVSGTDPVRVYIMGAELILSGTRA